mgnify:CR=1 FL=1
MTPSRGWESQPLRSKKLQALLLLIAGVRVWFMGCVLRSGRGCQPPFPAGGTYLPLAKGEQVATNIKVLSNVVDCEDVRADAIVLAALAAADKAARVALRGRRRRSEADSTVRCITRGVLRFVSRVYYVCICLVSCVYRARWCIMRVSVCIDVYQCVTISLIHITLADQGEIHVSRCITRVLRAYRRVSTRLRCNTRRIANTSLNDVIQLQIQ